MTVFVASAFKHGYDKSDFFEVLESGPLKLRSKRSLAGVFELFGRNFAGDYLHVAYRREGERYTVFHMRRMTDRERRMYRKHQ